MQRKQAEHFTASYMQNLLLGLAFLIHYLFSYDIYLHFYSPIQKNIKTSENSSIVFVFFSLYKMKFSSTVKKIILELSTGRLARNVIMTGNLLLNGKKARLDYGLVVSFLIQDFISHLTFYNKQLTCQIIRIVLLVDKRYLFICRNIFQTDPT